MLLLATCEQEVGCTGIPLGVGGNGVGQLIARGRSYPKPLGIALGGEAFLGECGCTCPTLSGEAMVRGQHTEGLSGALLRSFLPAGTYPHEEGKR